MAQLRLPTAPNGQIRGYHWDVLKTMTTARDAVIKCEECGANAFHCVESATKGSLGANMVGSAHFSCGSCRAELEVTYGLHSGRPLDVKYTNAPKADTSISAIGGLSPMYSGSQTADCTVYEPIPIQIAKLDLPALWFVGEGARCKCGECGYDGMIMVHLDESETFYKRATFHCPRCERGLVINCQYQRHSWVIISTKEGDTLRQHAKEEDVSVKSYSHTLDEIYKNNPSLAPNPKPATANNLAQVNQHAEDLATVAALTRTAQDMGTTVEEMMERLTRAGLKPANVLGRAREALSPAPAAPQSEPKPSRAQRDIE